MMVFSRNYGPLQIWDLSIPSERAPSKLLELDHQISYTEPTLAQNTGPSIILCICLEAIVNWVSLMVSLANIVLWLFVQGPSPSYIHTQLCVLIFASSASLKRWCGALLLVVFGLFLFLAGTGYIPPYSLSDPSNPRPKRIFLQVLVSPLIL